GFLGALRVLAVNTGRHFDREDAKDAKKTLRRLFWLRLGRSMIHRLPGMRQSTRQRPVQFPRFLFRYSSYSFFNSGSFGLGYRSLDLYLPVRNFALVHSSWMWVVSALVRISSTN